MQRRSILKAGGALAASLLSPAAAAQASPSLRPSVGPAALTLAQVSTEPLTLRASALGETPLTVQAASGQTAPLQVWQNSGGIRNFSVLHDGRPGLVPQTWRGDGLTSPSLAFSTDPDTGITQMPGVVENGNFAFISNGFYAATFEMSRSDFVLHTRAINRMMLLSESALVLGSVPGHFEIESANPTNFEPNIYGYRLGSAVSKTIVFASDPVVSAACPLAVRLPTPATVDAFQVRDGSEVVRSRFDQAGRIATIASTAPALSDLRDGEVALWVNPTTGDFNLTGRFAGELRHASIRLSA